MILPFSKYHGAGNDFIIVDNRDSRYDYLLHKKEFVQHICSVHFGIGADGLLLLNKHKKYDFEMHYFNSDGKLGTMCGNGGRCIAAFAYQSNISGEFVKFIATDGIHEAEIKSVDEKEIIVKLKMTDVNEITIGRSYIMVNTGSPHYVKFVDDIDSLDVYHEGRRLRYSSKFKEEGINVDFVKAFDDYLFVRTYERGVEDETLSCGTGATAVAIAAGIKGLLNKSNSINIQTLGGALQVSFDKIEKKLFENVYLEGPASYVFDGTIEI